MLKKLSDLIRSRTGKLTDEASATMVLWVPIVLIASLALWIFLGRVMDVLANVQYSFAAANPGIPVSADRVMISQWFISGYQSLLIASILLPILIYSIIVAKRRIDGQI